MILPKEDGGLGIRIFFSALEAIPTDEAKIWSDEKLSLSDWIQIRYLKNVLFSLAIKRFFDVEKSARQKSKFGTIKECN